MPPPKTPPERNSIHVELKKVDIPSPPSTPDRTPSELEEITETEGRLPTVQERMLRLSQISGVSLEQVSAATSSPKRFSKTSERPAPLLEEVPEDLNSMGFLSLKKKYKGLSGQDPPTSWSKDKLIQEILS